MISPSKRPPIKLPLPAFSIIIIFTILMIVGIAVIPLLSVRLEPSRTFNNVTVYFQWPKASAAMVEHEVTAKLEGLLSTVKGVKNVRSVSSKGSGYIQVDLDEHTKINECRYEIATLVRQVYPGLPVGVSYPMIHANRPDENDNKSILSYTINGRVNAGSIQQFAEKNIKPKLALLEGVYQVNIYGASQYGWELTYSTLDLVRYGVSTDDISSGISNYFRSFELGKAYVFDESNPGKPGYHYLTLRTSGAGLIQWDKIPVKKVGSRTIYLTDISKVRYAEQEPNSFYRINGLNTVNLEIVAGKNTNFIVLADKIKKQVKNIQQSLPSGYSIILLYDATEHLKTELDKITWRSVATLFILLVFVFAVSRSLRYLLLILISLLSNILLACILYYFFKLEINLYSLAGITVSIGMIIDNSIVVIDHIRHKNNMRVFLAVVGATLTTMGAVCIIFFLDEPQQLNLLDFAWVIILNLGISLVVALFFIPALMEKLPLTETKFLLLIRRKRKVVKWTRFYNRLIRFGVRFRPAFIIIIVLLFGIPVFMLPAKIEKKNFWADLYNSSFGSDFYNETIRPWTDKALGGTLRLFLSAPARFSYSDKSIDRTRLNIGITMPKGTELKLMNRLVLDWENYLSQFKEIEQFQSRVSSGQQAGIDILFKKEFEKGSFPFSLKSQLESKAVYTGLADFAISGVGQGFNNELNTETTNYGLTLLGYDFEALQRYADRIKTLLLENPRVEKVSIGSRRDWHGQEANYEFVFRINDPKKLLSNNLSSGMINKALTDFSAGKQAINSVFYQNAYVPVILSPVNDRASVWQVMNEAVRSDSGAYIRLKEFANIEKERTGNEILRENQQYQLVVNYNFIGDFYLGSLISERIIKQVSGSLPLGYTIKESERNFWGESGKKLTWAIFLTIGIVFVVCAILLNSILQPLAVIAMIPISFIGAFLVTWIFEYPFDEGGYAAFIVLCGVVVNAALFILNDYNNLRRDYPGKPLRLLFIKSYNSKIIPIILSTASMILGLVPFIVYSEEDPFWYALAMGVIGGLIFSMVAILLFLPLFLKGIGKGFKKKLVSTSKPGRWKVWSLNRVKLKM